MSSEYPSEVKPLHINKPQVNTDSPPQHAAYASSTRVDASVSNKTKNMRSFWSDLEKQQSHKSPPSPNKSPLFPTRTSPLISTSSKFSDNPFLQANHSPNPVFQNQYYGKNQPNPAIEATSPDLNRKSSLTRNGTFAKLHGPRNPNQAATSNATSPSKLKKVVTFDHTDQVIQFETQTPDLSSDSQSFDGTISNSSHDSEEDEYDDDDNHDNDDYDNVDNVPVIEPPQHNSHSHPVHRPLPQIPQSISSPALYSHDGQFPSLPAPIPTRDISDESINENLNKVDSLRNNEYPKLPLEQRVNIVMDNKNQPSPIPSPQINNNTDQNVLYPVGSSSLGVLHDSLSYPSPSVSSVYSDTSEADFHLDDEPFSLARKESLLDHQRKLSTKNHISNMPLQFMTEPSAAQVQRSMSQKRRSIVKVLEERSRGKVGVISEMEEEENTSKIASDVTGELPDLESYNGEGREEDEQQQSIGMTNSGRETLQVTTYEQSNIDSSGQEHRPTSPTIESSSNVEDGVISGAEFNMEPISELATESAIQSEGGILQSPKPASELAIESATEPGTEPDAKPDAEQDAEPDTEQSPEISNEHTFASSYQLINNEKNCDKFSSEHSIENIPTGDEQASISTSSLPYQLDNIKPLADLDFSEVEDSQLTSGDGAMDERYGDFSTIRESLPSSSPQNGSDNYDKLSLEISKMKQLVTHENQNTIDYYPRSQSNEDLSDTSSVPTVTAQDSSSSPNLQYLSESSDNRDKSQTLSLVVGNSNPSSEFGKAYEVASLGISTGSGIEPTIKVKSEPLDEFTKVDTPKPLPDVGISPMFGDVFPENLLSVDQSHIQPSLLVQRDNTSPEIPSPEIHVKVEPPDDLKHVNQVATLFVPRVRRDLPSQPLPPVPHLPVVKQEFDTSPVPSLEQPQLYQESPESLSYSPEKHSQDNASIFHSDLPRWSTELEGNRFDMPSVAEEFASEFSDLLGKTPALSPGKSLTNDPISTDGSIDRGIDLYGGKEDDYEHSEKAETNNNTNESGENATIRSSSGSKLRARPSLTPLDVARISRSRSNAGQSSEVSTKLEDSHIFREITKVPVPVPVLQLDSHDFHSDRESIFGDLDEEFDKLLYNKKVSVYLKF